jgi:hypothetical protein
LEKLVRLLVLLKEKSQSFIEFPFSCFNHFLSTENPIFFTQNIHFAANFANPWTLLLRAPALLPPANNDCNHIPLSESCKAEL